MGFCFLLWQSVNFCFNSVDFALFLGKIHGKFRNSVNFLNFGVNFRPNLAKNSRHKSKFKNSLLKCDFCDLNLRTSKR